MNFYKHYIGDFQRDTGHLSLIERGAYLALIHHYYATETPLPNDIISLCRIAGAVSKPEKAAVKAVMQFFTPVNSGLMHNRIEAEIEKAGELSSKNREIALAREAKRRTEKEAKATELSTTKRAQSVPRSRQDTSTPQTPDSNILNSTTTTKPENNNPVKSTFPAENSPPTLTDIDKSKADPILTRALEISIMLRKGGASLTMTDPNVLRWAESGVTDAQALTALETAQANRAAASSPQPINSGYLDSILRGGALPSEKKRNTGPPWWTSLDLMDAKARELGIKTAKIGESMDTYKGRISAKLAEAAKAES